MSEQEKFFLWTAYHLRQDLNIVTAQQLYEERVRLIETGKR